MGPSDQRLSPAHRRKPSAGVSGFASNWYQTPKTLLFAFYMLYIFAVVVPGKCVSTLRSGAQRMVLPEASPSLAALHSVVHVHPSSKQAALRLGITHGGSQQETEKRKNGYTTEKEIELKTAVQPRLTKKENAKGDSKPTQLQKFKDSGGTLPESTGKKPSEQLEQDKLLHVPYGEGISAILAESKAMVSMMEVGLAESKALKEAARISTMLRGEIVKDVEALSHTLEEEHANLGILRQYERQQDALLKAQLGYLTPMVISRKEEVPRQTSSAASFIGMPLYSLLGCIAILYLGLAM